MKMAFHEGNRKTLYETLPEGSLVLVFSGHAPRKTQDENYPFYANRNFVYLTGIEDEGLILAAETSAGGAYRETMFILPPDLHQERWNGRRIKADEVRARSGVENSRYIAEFDTYLHGLIKLGSINRVYLDLYKNDWDEADTDAFRMAAALRERYPFLEICSFTRQIKRQRTIKQPCEIEAMREAVKITRDGIVAMMKASKPGMYEYQYRAEFDYALAKHGIMSPAFPSIISAGKNNFQIHYYGFDGQAQDGDMILNDVGAVYDGMMNDVSRGWPCNGVFNERQRLLYTCAYNTSQHMFEIIKPGMPMADVDRLAREYNFEQLKAIGLCDRYEDVGKYIWHGGAHHVGWDVHDLVDMTMDVAPGMVFCVDIGIYCEEGGIGFRLEDNCLVTAEGCENLTASIPRTIEEIEAVMRKQGTVPI